METVLVPPHVLQARRRKTFVLMLTGFFILVQIVWVGMPILMAVMWSLVSSKQSWSYPDLFPPVLGFDPWRYVFKYTNIKRALATSFSREDLHAADWCAPNLAAAPDEVLHW